MKRRRASRRPAWVPKDFAGGCRVFPKEDTKYLPFQKRWVLDESRLKAWEKSRQIGATWVESHVCVRRQSMADCLYDSWITSRDVIQARLFLEDCIAFAQVMQIGADDLGEQVIDEDGAKAQMLGFANGRRIHSMSSNPDAQAGKRGPRTLDEFALNKDARKLYSIAYHGITWGGNLSMISTHRGSQNFFNHLILEIKFKGNPKNFSLHRTTLQDALDEGFLYKLQSKLPADDERMGMDEGAYFDFIRAGTPDEESFREECMCEPSDDDSAFLSYDLIDGCKYAPGAEWESDLRDAKNPLYIGVDIGRTQDLTVITVLERIVGDLFTRRMIELKKTRFAVQEAELYALLDLPQVRRCCIDETGIGKQFAERAREKYGSHRVEAVNFTAQVKEDLAYPLKAAFEDRRVRIPDSAVLTSDLRRVRKQTTASGNVRFAGERGVNGHSDRFWSLALGIHAAKPTRAGYSAVVI